MANSALVCPLERCSKEINVASTLRYVATLTCRFGRCPGREFGAAVGVNWAPIAEDERDVAPCRG